MGGIRVESWLQPIFLLQFISLFLVTLSLEEIFITIAVTVVFIAVFIALSITVLHLIVITTATTNILIVGVVIFSCILPKNYFNHSLVQSNLVSKRATPGHSFTKLKTKSGRKRLLHGIPSE
jgi:hypothetical protein